MSTYLYLTFAGRTVMVAKPATYQDLKREIHKKFPMLASAFSVLILFKPDLEDGSSLNNWVEVDPSAYNAVRNGVHIYINVAEPITKRYMFPLPDGRNSNVGPLNRGSHSNGMGNHNSPSMDGVPHDGQVSSKNSRTSTSKYHYPDSEPSPKPQRSDGAACASGWAGASEQFRRSARLIPDLKDCKEAVDLDVGESNCYPNEEEDADENWGHFQHEEEGCKEEKPHPGLTEKGWYTGAENFGWGGRQAVSVGLNIHDNCPATPISEEDVSYGGNQHDGDNAGKKIPLPKAGNMRTVMPQHVLPTGDFVSPTDGSPIQKDLSWGARYHRDLKEWPSNMNPMSKCESVWSGGDSGQGDPKGFFLNPSDYLEKPPCGSPDSLCAELRDLGGWRCSRHNQEDNAEQIHAHTAYTDDLNDFAPTTRTAPAAHRDDGLANQVIRNAHGRPRGHEGSNWSPPRRKHPGHGRPQQPQFQNQRWQPEPHHYPPPLYPSPPYGPLSPANSGRCTTGSSVAKFRRSSYVQHSNMTTRGQGNCAWATWANGGKHQQAQVQMDNDSGRTVQKYELQRWNDSGRGDDDLNGGNVHRSRAESKHGRQQHQRNDTGNFWSAPPENAIQSTGRGGGRACMRSGGAVGEKKATDKAGQVAHAEGGVGSQDWHNFATSSHD